MNQDFKTSHRKFHEPAGNANRLNCEQVRDLREKIDKDEQIGGKLLFLYLEHLRTCDKCVKR